MHVRNVVRLIFCILAAASWCLVGVGAYAANPAPGSDSRQPDSPPHDYRDKNFDYFVAGNPTLPRAVHTQFGLALMGGGGSVDSAFRFIAAHAGGGHIVILRAVNDDSFDPDDGYYGKAFVERWGPVASAETIVFHNRQAASDPRVIGALEQADGIFLAGGDQSNYVRYWKDTPVQTLLNAHVAANRPIGGSSAGLAILGHYSYTAFDGGSLESRVALADPFDSSVTLETDFLHFAGLENVVTDTHFGARHRLGRLLSIVARLNSEGLEESHRPLTPVFGIGIDERTALLVYSTHHARLADGSAGSAWIVSQPNAPIRLVKSQPLSVQNIRLVRLTLGSEIDLDTRNVRRAAAETMISVKDGKLTGESIASPIFSRDKAPGPEG